MMIAAQYGKTACVRLLMSKEARMQEQTYDGTALMFAASQGHLECVKLLAPLEKGIK